MKSYYIPRNYRGEGRILYIFSTKALIYTAVGVGVGLIFYFIFNFLKLTTVGIIIASFFGLLGFIIGTFKVPEMKKFGVAKKNAGENIDEVIKKWIMFKKKKNKIYTYISVEDEKSVKEEETKDEWFNSKCINI